MDVQNNKNIYNSVCYLGLLFRHVRFIILFRQVSGKLGGGGGGCFIFPSLLATRGLTPEDQNCPIKMKSKETHYISLDLYTKFGGLILI